MSQDGEDQFRPRLGRSKARSGGQEGMKAFLKASRSRSPRKSTRGGRSAGFAGARRVVIQAKFVRLGGGGIGGQRAHLAYLQRDGAGLDRERADFYNDRGEEIDGRDWLEEHCEDRHHFRFILSPEDGQKLDALKPFVRELVGQMEIDLETKLDWIAVDHHNTEHPHTHIVMSGKRDDGKDLVIPREYLSHGMRQRGSAILTRDLGLQTERELSAKLDVEIGHRKMTRMDRVLVRQQYSFGEADLARVQRNGEHYKARLHQLRSYGLATHVGGTRWAVDKQLGLKLGALERQDTIAKRIELAVRQAGLDRIGAHEDGPYRFETSVKGRLLKVGRADELHNKAYAIVDGLNGRVHHFDLGTSYPKDLQPGDMIEAKPRSPGALVMDQTIADAAASENGLYSAEAHRRFNPRVTATHLRMCERRLETLRRAEIGRQFNASTTVIPSDFIARIETHFEKAARRSPTIIRQLEGMDFERQVQTHGETWLDRQLADEAEQTIGHAGLGGEVRASMDQRMRWLRSRGLVSSRDAQTLSPGDMARLRQDGMQHAGIDVAKQTGLSYRPLEAGEKLEGNFANTYKTPDAKFAIIEHGKEFSLVPWNPELEKMRARQIQLMMSPSMQLSWTRGRERGLSR